jgi:perosamine synthetase
MKKIPYGKHYIDNQDIQSVTNILRSEFITQGTTVSLFEKLVCSITKSKYAVAVSSCTAGLHISMRACGFKKNDILLTSIISFVSSPNSAKFLDGKVQFVDIANNDSISIDIDDLVRKIKKYKPKVVMPVHMGGASYNSKIIKKLSKKYKFKIIEDAAHSFGGNYDKKLKIGSCNFSDLTVFSFHPVKTITTGEGGIVTTNNKILYKKLLRLRSHGINKNDDKFLLKKNAYTNGKVNPWYYEMRELGYHYRITDIQCALGISQLKKLKKIVDKRRKVSKFYDKLFKNHEGITSFQISERESSSCHLYILNINFKKFKKTRQELMEYLEKFNIITQVHYIPLILHPFYYKGNNQLRNYPNAKKYYDNCLSIPCFYKITLKDQKFVYSKIINFLEN